MRLDLEGPREGREDPEHGASARRHGPWRRQGLSFAQPQGDACFPEVPLEARFPFDREGLAPPVGQDLVHPPPGRQCRDLVHAPTRHHQESGTETPDPGLEAREGLQQELHSMGGAFGEEGIQHEKRDDLAILQALTQRCMVLQTKILPSEPDEAAHGTA